jgi:hypothetical protein
LFQFKFAKSQVNVLAGNNGTFAISAKSFACVSWPAIFVPSIFKHSPRCDTKFSPLLMQYHAAQFIEHEAVEGDSDLEEEDREELRRLKSKNKRAGDDEDVDEDDEDVDDDNAEE